VEIIPDHDIILDEKGNLDPDIRKYSEKMDRLDMKQLNITQKQDGFIAQNDMSPYIYFFSFKEGDKVNEEQ
jgi:hypothetical protein